MPEMELAESEAVNNEVSERKKFFWNQGVEDMVLWIRLPDNVGKRDIKVRQKSIIKYSEISILLSLDFIESRFYWVPFATNST